MQFEQYAKERDEAFLSLDKSKILNFFKKYNIDVPSKEEVMWAGVHKARLYLTSATEEQFNESFNWLVDHGYKPCIS